MYRKPGYIAVGISRVSNSVVCEIKLHPVRRPSIVLYFLVSVDVGASLTISLPGIHRYVERVLCSLRLRYIGDLQNEGRHIDFRYEVT
jgi:hypothetical protein